MDASEIVGLVRAAFVYDEQRDDPYPMKRTEVEGADAVGTDAYPALRDAWPRLVEALASPAADVRIAAAYALAFIVEHAAQTQSALDAALKAAEMPLERAAMILAAGRLRGSITQWRTEPPYSWDGIKLTEEAARETSRVLKAALVIAELFVQPRWGRKVKPELEVALRAVERDTDEQGEAHVVSVGPWGGGDLGRFAKALLETCLVMRDQVGPHAVYGAPPPDDLLLPDVPPLDEGPALDPAEQAALDEVQAAFAAAEASIAEREVADPYTQERPVRAAAPRVELEGLRDIDWASLEHAYGKAMGVPAMIDALSSPDEGDRAWGYDALIASINHQGSVYSASGPAVPFLVKLVERDEIENRVKLLGLLAGLAVHDPSWYLFHELEEAQSTAFEAVSAGAPVFLRLLADADPGIRTMAAYVLSFVRPPDGAAVAVKRALAIEKNRYTRSSLLLALGYVGRRTKRTADRAVIERYLEDDCMLMAACAAIALAQIDRDACSPRVRAVLAKTITDVPPTTGVWPWSEGSPAGFARIVRLGILTVDEMIDEADAARERGDWQSGRDYAVKAFDRTFRDPLHGVTRLWLPRELDDRQRRILRFLVAISTLPEGAAARQFPMDSRGAYSAGIHTSVEAVKRLVGDATGPLDREIGEVPAWFAIDEVVGQRASLDALRAAFATIAPATRVEMVEDALSGPFVLHHDRTPMDFANPAHYEREKDTTSRFIAVASALLVDTELVGNAHARAMADEQAAMEHPRSIRCLVAATVLATHANARGEEPPAIIDRLVLTDQAPAGTFRIAIRAALDLLSPERKRRLLGDLPLYGYWSYRDPRGEVRRWYSEHGWGLVDLLEPAACVAKLEAAWHEWQRHRAAGDDPNAQPVRGSSTSSLEQKPQADQEFPIERAIEILDQCGEIGRELRDQLTRSTSAPTISTSL